MTRTPTISRWLAATVTAALFLAGLPACEPSGGGSTDTDPNRVKLEEMLTSPESPFREVPQAVIHALATSVPSSVLLPLIPGSDSEAEADYDFVMDIFQSPYPEDTTAEEWHVYAGNGDWGSLTIFRRDKKEVLRLTGQTWRVPSLDSLVRAAPPAIRIESGAAFGMRGTLIIVDGLVDPSGNMVDEILHRQGGRLERMTSQFFGLSQRQRGMARTETRYEDIDGDGLMEIACFRTGNDTGGTAGTRPAPARALKYDPKQLRFVDIHLPRAPGR